MIEEDLTEKGIVKREMKLEIDAVTYESTEVPNARLCSVLQKETNAHIS